MTSRNTAPDDPQVFERDLAALVEPIVAAAGFDLEELSVKRAGRKFSLRVVVDGDNGVKLDEAAAVSSAVSAALDARTGASEVFRGEPYTLEVTSPGVDRPLTEPRHWRRNVGRKVVVKTSEGEVLGRVVAADDSGITLAVERKGQTPKDRVLPYDDLGAGAVQLEFRRETESIDDTSTDE